MKPEKLQFYRAMSITEYTTRQMSGVFMAGTEWVERNLEQECGGVQFWAIKMWVDEGFYGDRLHDVIVAVEGTIDEFFIPKHIIPPRYMNKRLLNFDRATTIYDPRAVVSQEPVLLGEE